MQQNRSIDLIFELIMHKIIGINIVHHCFTGMDFGAKTPKIIKILLDNIAKHTSLLQYKLCIIVQDYVCQNKAKFVSIFSNMPHQ
jgi:hypothetical protein